MAASLFDRSSPSWRSALLALLIIACGAPLLSPAPAAPPALDVWPPKALVRGGDRVAWIGSSSTRIGVWTRTVEFLLRTRQPELKLRFERFTTGAGTFATGLEHIDEWTADFRPTVVVFNYGGNDAAVGRNGLPKYWDNLDRCVARAADKGARVVLVTPQASDVRKAGAEASARRSLYAESMLSYGREHGWTVIDVHHPLEALQRANEKGDPAYSILKDTIHLTDPAYVAWGYFFYDRLDLPFVRSDAVVSAGGQVAATEQCEILDVEAGEGVLAFTRIDKVLPILPPGPLPPRLSVPLESQSRYMLTVTSLKAGQYEIQCEGRPIGVVSADSLAAGVNLNTVLLDGNQEAPWSALAQAVWEGKELDRIGRTRWRFVVRKL